VCRQQRSYRVLDATSVWRLVQKAADYGASVLAGRPAHGSMTDAAALVKALATCVSGETV